ncbi:MAG: DUF378 domain-containing protein [Patescibacteria group bacterium]
MKGLHIVAFILLVVGGLNWGLVGIGTGDLVTRFLGEGVANIVFIIVGLAAILEIVTHKKSCKACEAGGAAGGTM